MHAEMRVRCAVWMWRIAVDGAAIGGAAQTHSSTSKSVLRPVAVALTVTFRLHRPPVVPRWWFPLGPNMRIAAVVVAHMLHLSACGHANGGAIYRPIARI